MEYAGKSGTTTATYNGLRFGFKVGKEKGTAAEKVDAGGGVGPERGIEQLGEACSRWLRSVFDCEEDATSASEASEEEATSKTHKSIFKMYLHINRHSPICMETTYPYQITKNKSFFF